MLDVAPNKVNADNVGDTRCVSTPGWRGDAVKSPIAAKSAPISSIMLARHTHTLCVNHRMPTTSGVSTTQDATTAYLLLHHRDHRHQEMNHKK